MGSSSNDKNTIFSHDDQYEMDFDRMDSRSAHRKPRLDRAGCEELKRKSERERQRRKARREKHWMDWDPC